MIIILTGESASGKDTIKKELNIPCILQTTTRPIRENEKDGADYHFVTKDKFEELIKTDNMVTYDSFKTLFNGNPDIWYYGVTKDELDTKEAKLLITHPNTALKIKEKYPDNCFIFYIHADEKIRTERAKKRGTFSETEWERRIKTDREDFKDFSSKVDVIIEANNNTPKEIANIINSHISKFLSL